jgi:hypothetical protein
LNIDLNRHPNSLLAQSLHDVAEMTHSRDTILRIEQAHIEEKRRQEEANRGVEGLRKRVLEFSLFDEKDQVHA